MLGVGGGYDWLSIHRLYLRSGLVTGVVLVAEAPDLPFKTIDLVMGNDVAGVTVLPEVSECPVDPPEARELESEFPEVFTACVVTRAQANKRAEETKVQQEPMDPLLSDLSDSLLSQWDNSLQSAVAAVEGDPVNSVVVDQGQQGVDPPGSTGEGAESEEQVLRVGTEEVPLNRESLVCKQREDSSLKHAIKLAVTVQEAKEMPKCYLLRDGVLCRKWRPPTRPADAHWATLEQVILPQCYRKEVLRLAHESVLGGHLGSKKTMDKICRHFFWPSIRKDVKRFCRCCHSCQMVGKPGAAVPVAPLQPLPVEDDPFARIMVDCVGLLPKSRRGYEYLLTIMDVATRYPEAFPFRSIKAKTIVEHLIKFFSWAGLPRSIQSDRGSNFTSRLYQQVMAELQVSPKHSSVYHPQSQGAIERFHGTLKRMIRTFVEAHPKEWDEAIPFLLFATRDAPTESLGFCPFELVFGHEVTMRNRWLTQSSLVMFCIMCHLSGPSCSQRVRQLESTCLPARFA